EETGGGRPGDLDLLGERLGGEGHPVTERLEPHARTSDRRLSGQAASLGFQMKPGPPGPRERPLLFRAHLEAAVDVADVEFDGWWPVPASVLTPQEVAEEALLQAHSMVGVELGEVFEAVDLEPLLLRRGARVAFEVAACMQRMAPVAR